MMIPADWVSETELRAANDIADRDRSEFHPNLPNWRHFDVMPTAMADCRLPMIEYQAARSGHQSAAPAEPK